MSRKSAAATAHDVTQRKQRVHKQPLPDAGPGPSAELDEYGHQPQDPVPPPHSPRYGMEQRIILPTVARHASRLDTVATTLSALTAQANRGWNSLRAASTGVPATNAGTTTAAAIAASDFEARRDGAISPVYDAFENTGDTAAGADRDGEHARRERPADQVEWSRWDRLRVGPRLVPVLISAYASGTLQMLQVDGDNVKEILNLPSTALQDHDHRYMSPPPRILAACCRPGAQAELLVVVDAPLEVLSYSLETHTTLHRARLSGPDGSFAASGLDRCDLQCNERFACVSLSHPGSIHVLRTDGLLYAMDVLVDVASSPHHGNAPMSLSGRLLAYATTRTSPITEIVADVRRPTATSGLSTAAGVGAGGSVGGVGGVGSGSGGATSGGGGGGRTRSNTQSHGLSGVRDAREQMMETSAQVGDVARRVSGNVLSGMRTLGEWGSNYLAGTALSPPAAGQLASSPNGGQSGPLSRSAPISSHLSQRPASSAAGSPRLTAVSSNGTRARRSPTLVEAEYEAMASTSTVVRIVDLGRLGSAVATFVPSGHPVAHVALSPNGQLCLTADSLGHAFHVFEVQVVGAFGGSRDAREAQAPPLHRYKLLRGVTSAEVVAAQWSADTQWVAVCTRTGTVHIYALNPFGGPNSVRNHITGKICNATSIPPLSVTVSSVVRTARPSVPVEGRAKQHDTNPSPSRLHGPFADSADGVVEDPTDALRTLAAPAFMMLGAAQRPEGSLFAARSGSAHSCAFDLLTFDSKSLSVSLHTAEMSSSRGIGEAQGGEAAQHSGAGRRPGSASATIATHGGSSGGGVGGAGGSISIGGHAGGSGSSSGTSGLTQMMRKAGGGLLHGGSSEPRLTGECHRVAVWNGLAPVTRARNANLPVISSGSTWAQLSSKRRAASGGRSPRSSIAKAEIETYSQALRVLPASIYLSRQCFFFVFEGSATDLLDAATGLLALHRAPTRSLAVRQVATIVGLSGADLTYDDRLAGAFDELDISGRSLDLRSPSSRIPSFPQGHRAKTAGWTSRSIPIRTVAGGIGGGLYRAGRELSRGVELARRRTNGSFAARASDGSKSQEEQHTSLSFDGDDGDVDMFAELRHRGGPGSAASMASHVQPSSAETPLTAYSAESRPGQEGLAAKMDTSYARDDVQPTDDDEFEYELGWDAFAEPGPAPDRVGTEKPRSGRNVPVSSGPAATAAAASATTAADCGSGAANFEEDDFTVGFFDDEDDDLAGCIGGPASAVRPRAQSPGSDTTASPKGLVYTLRGSSAGVSGRSGLRGSLAIEQPAIKREESPALSVRSNPPSSSDSGQSSSGSSGQDHAAESGGSGQLCEGNKETHTSAPSLPPVFPGSMPESVTVAPSAAAAAVTASAMHTISATPAVTVGTAGVSKKKKKGKR
ncbi:hypothetical protein ACQY0O_001743 [Thecaphora frezii]